MLIRDEVTGRLTGDKAQPLTELSWYGEADRALDDPGTRILAIWAMRQSSKTTYAFRRAIGELLTVPNASILFLSAAREQATTIWNTKGRKPLLRLLRAAGLPASTIKMTQSGAENPALNSVLEVVSPTEDTSVSRSVSLLVVDEARWVPDKVFASVVSSIIGAGGKALVLSTPGSPEGFFHLLCTGGDPAVKVLRVTKNENPFASQEAIGVLSRLLHRLLPATARRDIEGEFAGDEDAVITRAMYDAAECPGHAPVEAYDPEVPELIVAGDLGLRDDCAAVVAVFVDPETRQLVLARHRIWRPVKGETLDIGLTVESYIRELCEGFRVALIRLDPWQAMRTIQQLRAEGKPVEEFQQTPSNLVRMAVALVEAFKYERVVLYEGADDLREHVLSVVATPTSYGVRLAKEKSSRKVDACIALAMALVAASERPILEPAKVW